MTTVKVLAGLILLAVLGVTGWALVQIGTPSDSSAPSAPLVPVVQGTVPNPYAIFEVKAASNVICDGVTSDGRIRFHFHVAYFDHEAVSGCTVYAICYDSFGDEIRPHPFADFGTVPAGEDRSGSIPIPPGAVRTRLETNGTWVSHP